MAVLCYKIILITKFERTLIKLGFTLKFEYAIYALTEIIY